MKAGLYASRGLTWGLATVAGCASWGLAVGGCSSDHRVSPWGTADAPRLSALAAPPDLAAQLASIDAETSRLGLVLTSEHGGKLPRGGGPVVARAYEGEDPLGRKVHAVRVATSRGVVMAVGPPDALRPERAGGRMDPGAWATELVTDLGGLAGPLADMNGDGWPDLLLRDEAGVLAIFRVEAMGSTRLPIAMEVAPTRVVEAGSRLELAGQLAIPEGDALAPALDDLATVDGGGYSDETVAARAYHAERADALAGLPEGEGDAGAPLPIEETLRRAIERAWHEVLAGRSPKDAVDTLAAAKVPAALRASVDRWARVLEELERRRAPPAGK